MNALVGRKVAIVTPHPQTTRTHLLGVLNLEANASHPAGQIAFVDTPGVHRGRGHLSRALLRSVRTGLEGRDLSLFLADVTRPFGAEDQMALGLVEGTAPVFLLLNKLDCLPRRDQVLPIIEAYRQRFAFAEILPISALRRQNLDELVRAIVRYLPEGPLYFPADQTSDQPERFLIAEIVREQAMLATRAEVPHTVTVRVEADSTRQQRIGLLRVLHAGIYCERPGQKAILIGQGGEMIRKIGTAARHELEALLGTRVMLELRVLVRADWRDNPRWVATLDFRHDPEPAPEFPPAPPSRGRSIRS